MIYDLQKASVLKRISAWLLDFILLAIVITGLTWGLAAAMGYYQNQSFIADINNEYDEKYFSEINGEGCLPENRKLTFDTNIMTAEKYGALSEDEKAYFDSVYDIYKFDERVNFAFAKEITVLLSAASIAIILAYLALEFFVPLKLGNGQTIGKKIFAIGVMQVNGVRITNISLFVRSMLGKCTIETMVPALISIMILRGAINIVGLLVLALIAIFQIILLISTKTNSLIHDIFAFTVTVDMPSQMIFDTEADLIAYKKRIHAEAVENAKY
jgi:uncharacterized RDD family membrane protein YckC